MHDFENELYITLDKVIPGGSRETLNGSTKRELYLSHLSLDGLHEMHEYSTNEKLYEYLYYKPFTQISETRAYLSKLLAAQGEVVHGRTAMGWFIRSLKDDKLLGTARLLNINYERQSVEWGWGFGPNYWGDGYIFELMDILKSYVFENLRLNKLFGVASVDNRRSISALLATGVQEEGILRQHYRDYNGNYHDAWAYSLLLHEYLEAKNIGKSDLLNCETKQITKEQLIKLLSSELGYKDLSGADEMSTVPSWDSLSHVTLMLALEEKFKIKLSPREIAKCRSVESIYDILADK